jgi:hypothetical protein
MTEIRFHISSIFFLIQDDILAVKHGLLEEQMRDDGSSRDTVSYGT